MTATQADSTLVFIQKKVRRLTASASENSLTTNDLNQYINNFYNNDFPYGIKIDQMRSVYTFFSRPYIDRYPVDVNYIQGIRAPMYVEGIQGSLYKDRQQFYALWPRFPTLLNIGGSSTTGTITGIAQPTSPAQITSVNHNLTTGAVITISNVGGMTQLNGNSYTITVIDANTFSLNGIDNTAYGAYTSGGTWVSLSQTFSFMLPSPFLSKEVVIGGTDTNGNAISINDDGYGNLNYLYPNPVVSVPVPVTIPTPPASYNVNTQLPGMYNLNTGNPGLNSLTKIGKVNYVTGQIDFTLPSGISLALGTQFTTWTSQYQTGRPYSMLFWNNEITIRPIPKLIHKIEIECFLTPVQFMLTTDSPILNQWAQYIAYGTAAEILRDRQDMEGVANLQEGMLRQEGLVLERQGIEELFTPNVTIFNSVNPAVGGVNGIGYF